MSRDFLLGASQSSQNLYKAAFYVVQGFSPVNIDIGSPANEIMHQCSNAIAISRPYHPMS
jgi:hypothetical protein